MVDEITDKHFARSRIRGAPAVIPGTAGMVRSYRAKEIRRQTARAIELPMAENFTVQDIQAAQNKLASFAAIKGLRALEGPVLAMAGDPMENTPQEWSWSMLLPVSGNVQVDEDSEISAARIHGGLYIETTTLKGFPDLRNVYTYLLGDFLPGRKQQLTRPLIYHRVLDGLERGDAKKLSLMVFIPYQLTLKAPRRLVDRETMT